MRNHATLLLACTLLAACDSPTGPLARPNTDVGLAVWADVQPALVSIRDPSAAIRIRIFARNPSGDTLRIRSGGPPYVFTSDPTKSRGLEESFRIAKGTDSLHAGPSIDYWGNSEYVFAPRKTEHTEEIITLRSWRQERWPLSPGTYQVRSYYNGREGRPARFIVRP